MLRLQLSQVTIPRRRRLIHSHGREIKCTMQTPQRGNIGALAVVDCSFHVANEGSEGEVAISDKDYPPEMAVYTRC